MSVSAVNVEPARAMRLACPAMGTRFELLLVDDGRGAAELRAVGEAALELFRDLDTRLSRFRRDSLVAFLEREAVGRPVPVDEDTLALLADAVAVHALSGGLFDPCLGGDAAASPRVGPCGIELDAARRTVRLAPGTRLDLGGIAKGHGIDLAVRLLREAGVVDAFLHGGTSAIAAMGRDDRGDPWRVALPLPGAASGAAAGATLTLRDECLCVSAPHARLGDRRWHIVDPRRGTPLGGATVAAVRGASCRLCDAWTKPALLGRCRPAGLPRDYDCLLLDEPAVTPTPRQSP